MFEKFTGKKVSYLGGRRCFLGRVDTLTGAFEVFELSDFDTAVVRMRKGVTEDIIRTIMTLTSRSMMRLIGCDEFYL